jgi:excisionase family DNA binding protein
MPGPAVRCPACGHVLSTVDEPAWPVHVNKATPLARGEAAAVGHLLYRVAEAAESLAISRSSLYHLISAGEIQTVFLGRTVRIPRRELERLASETDRDRM